MDHASSATRPTDEIGRVVKAPLRRGFFMSPCCYSQPPLIAMPYNQRLMLPSISKLATRLSAISATKSLFLLDCSMTVVAGSRKFLECRQDPVAQFAIFYAGFDPLIVRQFMFSHTHRQLRLRCHSRSAR